MSANNYNLVYKIKNKWYVWTNLNAEETVENEVLTPKNADEVFDSLDEAIKYSEEEYAEYGTTTIPRKPKDGFKETIKEE